MLLGNSQENSQKVPLYLLPRLLYRSIRWRTTYRRRTIREFLQRFKKYPEGNQKNPMVFMTGMPRTGSSLMKNFLGTHSALKAMPFQHRGFYVSWERSFQEEKVLLDKSTHYIRHLEKIIATCKNQAYICCIVRDPRSQLYSLFEFEGHPEISRGLRFWKQWHHQYQNYLNMARKYQHVNFFLIRYEDLVREPEKAKIAFLEWLKLEEKSVSNRYEIANHNDIQDPKVSMKRTVSQGSLFRWRDTQDPQQRKMLMAYEKMETVKKLMTSFGYLPELGSIQLDVASNIKIFQMDALEESKLQQ